LFLIQAELLRINLEILIFFLFVSFTLIAHQFECQSKIKSFNHNFLQKFSTVSSYLSSVKTSSKIVFQNQGKSGIITQNQAFSSNSQTFIQLSLLPHQP